MASTIFSAELLQYKTIVLCNGEFPSNEIALRFIQQAERIICCDGAVEKLLQFGKYPDIVIGDCDSISESLCQKLKTIIIEDKDTEKNDLQKALNYCKSNNYNNISIVGACGLREDHQLANLAILDMFSADLNLIMVSNHGIFSFISEPREFDSFPGQAVSIFNLNGKARFTFHGLRYPVYERRFAHLWEGSLNVSESERFRIEIEGGRGIIFRVFQN
ncbi:MAG: thiamine diphosphokinase [Bacteroidales bacterium]|nr:thiamine diphosphokinase [Bacteroidales bacterium]